MEERKITRREKREASDLRIITSAIKCFGENGYNNTTMANIAKNAGVTSGLLGQRYESKLKLFFEAYKKVVDDSEIKSKEYRVAPACFYKNIEDLKEFSLANRDEFNFLKMVFNSTDLPEDFYNVRLHEFNSAQISNTIIEAQKNGYITKGNPYHLYQAFLLQVVNQIDISNRFDMAYPELSYFLRIFQITDEEHERREKQEKLIVDAFCGQYSNLAYIHVLENRADELLIEEDYGSFLDNNDAKATFDNVINNYVESSCKDTMRTFLDFSTLDSRMSKKRFLFQHFNDINGRKKVAVLILAKKNEEKKVIGILAGIQDMD